MVKYSLFLSLVLSCTLPAAGQTDPEITLHDSALTIVYRGEKIFEGNISPGGLKYRVAKQAREVDGARHHIVTITAGNFTRIQLSGSVHGSEEAIACESEPLDRGLRVVRHVYGTSRSALNNAVYDRKGDWLLSVDRFTPNVTIVPQGDRLFQLSVRNWEIVIRFRPEYYRKHRGLTSFRPSEYSVWKSSVAGWCSWFAYFDSVDEASIKKTADVLAEKLKPFGLEYVQMDDGYQQQPIGLPDHWTVPNEKFPSGLGSLASYISSKGLLPGIWTNVSFADSAAAYADRGLFVRDAEGKPALGNWVGYPMDGSNPAAIEKLITPVYRQFRTDGWRYFKLDALRHLRYEGYNAYAEHFARAGKDPDEALRNVVGEVRRQIGRENFLLACWGIRPELTGLVDGCRIGSDGYSYAGLAQYNSYNNIVWRIDPDHIVLSEAEAYRSCTATSLTGSLFMLTDKPELYERSPLIDAARRSIPVLFTLPVQVYDVDPSRSSRISLARVELSGSGPRPFDASSSTTTGLFSLEIAKQFERWLVLGRLDERERVLPLKELGLDGTKEYLVFEFWRKEFRGVARGEFVPGPFDTTYRCQVFCFREKLPHPQLVATNRHISCGALEVRSLAWEGNSLHGTSELVAEDPYMLYVHEPPDVGTPRVSVMGGTLIGNEKKESIRIVTIRRESKGTVEWKIVYE